MKVRKRKLRLSLVFSNANASFGNWCNSTTAALIWAETAGWMDMFCVFHYQNNGGLSCSRIQYVTHQTNCTLATDHRITNINLCQRSFHRMSCFVFVCFFRIYASCLLYCLIRTHTSGDFLPSASYYYPLIIGFPLPCVLLVPLWYNSSRLPLIWDFEKSGNYIYSASFARHPYIEWLTKRSRDTIKPKACSCPRSVGMRGSTGKNTVHASSFFLSFKLNVD